MSRNDSEIVHARQIEDLDGGVAEDIDISARHDIGTDRYQEIFGKVLTVDRQLIRNDVAVDNIVDR